MQLRRFQPADAASIVKLFRDTVRRINSRDYAPEQVRVWAPDEIDVEKWTARLASHFTVVAVEGEEVLGFADLEDGHIDRFYVHADYQGRGIGRAMLLAIEAEARQQRQPRLFTEASITARPFFERHGFVVLEQRQVRLRDVEFINYRMEKQL